MKSVLVFSALFVSFALSAQNADSVKIKASDPTQLYTFVEGYGGLSFEIWEFGFHSNIAFKKFRIGTALSVSNNAEVNRLLDDIQVDIGYQIHNNTGLYSATVINAGFTAPSQSRRFDYEVNVFPNASAFNKYFFNYLGALRFNKHFSFYPGIEWFSKQNNRSVFFFLSDSSYGAPNINSMGWKLSAALSYDINPKSFIQFYYSWSTEKWAAKYGTVEAENEFFSSIAETRNNLIVQYQYAFTPFAQSYLRLHYYDYLIESDIDADIISGRTEWTVGFRLGFIYFLN